MSKQQIARYRLGDDIHFGLLDGQWLRRLPGTPYEGVEPGAERDPLSAATLLCPLDAPRVFAVGMNYKGHIQEAGAETPDFPQMFMMPTTCVIGPDDAIILPREAQIVHHECELGIVIGTAGRRIPEAEAEGHIFGYTCANDVSERVIQNKEMAYGCLLIGKAFDTFCPIGPFIATGLDPANLGISTRVNGELRQSGNTNDLLFSVPNIVSYVSQAITLLPGDIILTGTPSGVGPLAPGDICEVSIEGVGTLSNPVIAEQ